MLTLPGTRRCSALGKGRRKAVGLGVKAQGGGETMLHSDICWVEVQAVLRMCLSV